jgi:hypothetical protein
VDKISGASDIAVPDQYGDFTATTLRPGDILKGIRFYFSSSDTSDVTLTLTPAQASRTIAQGTLRDLDIGCGSMIVRASAGSAEPNDIQIEPGNAPIDISTIAPAIPKGSSLTITIELSAGCLTPPAPPYWNGTISAFTPHDLMSVSLEDAVRVEPTHGRVRLTALLQDGNAA